MPARYTMESVMYIESDSTVRRGRPALNMIFSHIYGWDGEVFVVVVSILGRYWD